MAKIKDLIGQKFGRLTVISFSDVRNYNSFWLCKCDCGGEKIVRGVSLTKRYTQSSCCKSRSNNGDYLYNTIDRLDSNEGYTLKNSVPCCSICNTMKMDMSLLEFYRQISKILKHVETLD